MLRIDLARLRKDKGMSQRELADILNVKQSFLSAIENGRSSLPNEKRDKIARIFNLTDFSHYMIDTEAESIIENSVVAGKNEAQMLTQLLSYFHQLAHKNDNMTSESQSSHIEALEKRIETLLARNEELLYKIDSLRNDIDELRNENFRLKELLIGNGIKY